MRVASLRGGALMERVFFGLGSISALVAVALGAFAAHGLKSRLAPDMLAVFETAVRYQMYHALALLGAAWACTKFPGGAPLAGGWFFLAGTLLFCGSLYALSLGGPRWLGPVTPVGGLAFLAGWACLGWAALKA